MSRILVTGGGGYIGSVLVPDLLDAGHEVHVIDSFMYHENSLALSMRNPNLQVDVFDIREQERMAEAVSAADVIVPLAAIVGAPACARDKVGAESINLHAPLSLFKLIRDDQQIIMPTTNSAYGTTAAGEVCTEESDLNPISLYAKHKVEVEEELFKLAGFTSFRLATVFGMSPRMRLDLLVNDLTNRALIDRSVVLFEADFIRNYVHVRDVSSAINWAITNPDLVKGQIFNVGLTEANLSKRQLCEAIQRHVPGFAYTEAATGRDPDQRNYTVSNEKIESAGFVFSVGLDAGLAELVKGLPTLLTRRYTNL
ncbi:MAG: NAD-dependent epimerase/dehydratase [Actinomycetota bacterium]|nr:NAD-dependent epimerase/dehydratase [Actinomycetota bacterium]